MIDSAAAGLVVEACKDGKTSLVNYLGQKYDYLKDLDRNHGTLNEELGKLQARRDDIKAEISRDKRMQPTSECENWILRVPKIEEEVRLLNEKFNQLQRSNKWLHLLSNSKISQKMVKKSEEVRRLWLEGSFERGVVAAKLPNPVEKMGALNIKDKKSLNEVVEGTLKHLGRDDISRIGIWGTLGIGKTTIMQNLNDNEDIAKMFDMVIWLTVSNNPDIEKLQEVIIQRLKLNVQSISNIKENARRISDELNGKKCLILLDEVSKRIDLHEVMGFRNIENDCKVVLASRSRRICIEMDCNELIKVKSLSAVDAWNMFQEIVGDAISSPSIKKIAELAVEQCGRLPLVIDRIARAFRNKEKDIDLWKQGLRRLQRWDSKAQGIEEVLELLKLCYQDLDDTKKICFLYGALYPEECEICVDYLLECWRAEGFMDYTNEFTYQQGEGHVILNELIDLSLLEKSVNRKCIKMNKVIRKMALKMSSQRDDFKFLVKPREGLKDFPKREEWEKATRISLMDNRLRSLPDNLLCPNLLTLFLQRNKLLIAIPETFFQSMESLRVLDLHGTGIESLPSSLSNLIHLRGLLLNSCIKLVEFPFKIETLGNLELLDIRGTKINLLQIGSSEKVKGLRISSSNFGIANWMENHIELKISSFSSLEEFSIDVDCSKTSWDKIVDTVKKEVAILEKLTSLQFCFPEVDCLELSVSASPVWKNDSCLTFQFANAHHDSKSVQILKSSYHESRHSLKVDDDDGGVDSINSNMLMDIHALGLINCKGVSRLSDFGIDNMDNIFVCVVKGCNEIETVVNGEGITKAVLKCLEHLCINNVLSLKSIWEGPVSVGSLTRLTNLTVSTCPKLKKIFSTGMIPLLPQLQHLRVEECCEIEEIIMESENSGLEANALPKLKTLALLHLPNLRSIWVDDSLEWPSLLGIKISVCGKLKRLPFNSVNATQLRYIQGQQRWWEALIWKDDAIKRRLPSLSVLN